jgi:uncharacterized membrane protein YbhN (UPF0104 family)
VVTGAVLPALRTFFEHLGAVSWQPLFVVLLSQTLRMVVRSRAWRNILAAAYPTTNVRWRSVFAAYTAGVGVNAVIPARSGDVLKLYIVKQRVPGSTYPTLASSLLADGITDILLAACVLTWALASGVLPGVKIVRHLPSVDWFWLVRHPSAALIIAGVVIAAGLVLATLLARRIRAFWERVGQGLAILRMPRQWLLHVASWQFVDWCLRLATIFFALKAFHVTASFENALRIQATQSLATVLPLTPSGIGTGQALAVYALRGQATKTAIVSFSVGMQLVVSLWAVIVGTASILITLRSLRWRRIVEQDEAVAADPQHVQGVDSG